MLSNRIEQIYRVLFAHFGPQHWWPGDSPFEVMVGAVLTQNTNWRNVETAIGALKEEGALDFETLEALPLEHLAALIRPSGYYNQKAKRLKDLLAAIRQDSGDLDSFLAQPLAELREKLLAIKGIGPETADSIILYAAKKPVFVVDAYTQRILFRHHCLTEDDSYDDIQGLFHSALPEDPDLFNEYHALLVRTAKEYCRKTEPLCATCPLQGV